MSRIKLQERVENALKDEATRTYADTFIESLQKAIQNIENRLRSSTLLFIVFMVAFMFFSQARISEVSLGPFKLGDASVAYKLLPGIVAFFFFDFAILFVERGLLNPLYDTLMAKLYKGLAENDFHNYIIEYANPFTFIPQSKEGLLGKFQSFLSMLLIVIIYFLLPISFEVYAFVHLFTQYGVNDIFVWISLVVSAIMMFQAYYSFVDDFIAGSY